MHYFAKQLLSLWLNNNVKMSQCGNDDNFVPYFRVIDGFEIAQLFQLKIGSTVEVLASQCYREENWGLYISLLAI